jgi:hypothetical protein
VHSLLSQDEFFDGSSADLASCASYALFVNDPDLAMRYVTKSLAINPGCSLAIVNKGLAHLQLGQSAERDEVSDSLITQRMPYRFQAAGYAMRGDLKLLIPPLQRAFALGEYAPRSAFRDVAFRPYWQMAPFVEATRQFAGSDQLKAERLSYYPLSVQEEQLRERVTSAHDSTPVNSPGGLTRH